MWVTCPAGHYTLGNILEAHLPLNLDERATVVLIDDGVVAIDFTIGRSELRTADSIPVGVTGRFTIRNRDSRSFIANLLKGKSRILLADLQEDLRYDLLGVVQSTLSGYRMDDLYGNLAVRESRVPSGQTSPLPLRVMAFPSNNSDSLSPMRRSGAIS